MRPFLPLMILLPCIIVIQSFSQVVTRKTSKEEVQQIVGKKSTFLIPKKIVLPSYDFASMIAEDTDNKNGILRFGKDFNVTLNDKDGTFSVDSTSIWKIEIYSNKAYSINVIFDTLKLSSDAKLFLYNKTGTMITGPITRNSTV